PPNPPERRHGRARSPLPQEQPGHRVGGSHSGGPNLPNAVLCFALHSPDPCASETVLNAIRESRKRAVEQKREDQAFGNDQESKRRRHDSSGSGQSAFEPLVANGTPTSLIPKPGSLKRNLVSHCPDDCSNKRSRTSSMSSLNNTYAAGIPSSTRNAIASSYSSSRGLSQLQNRSGMSVSPPSSPASSCSQTPEWPFKKPLPPLLGYSITSEDLDAERAAALQRLNRALEDKADAVPSTTAETTFAVTSPEPAPASTAPVLANTNSLLDSLKKMQSSQPPPSAAQPPAPAVSLESSSLPTTSADTKPVPVLSTPAPAAPTALGVQAPSNLASPAFPELGQTPSKPPSLPKPSTPFGVLNTLPASQPAITVAAAVPTTSPIFKPIFGALQKSESTAPCTAVVSTTVTVSASSGPSSTPSTTTMFKPIFGSVTAASSPAAASPFAFEPTSQPASASDLPAASTTTQAGFTGLPNVIFTTAATTATMQSSSTDATIKPIFSFGLNPPASTGPTTSLTVTAATSTSTSQPFLFQGLASSAPSTETSFATPGPMFQFGKPPPATVTATTSVPGGPAFGQAPSNSTAPTTTVGFSIFGDTTLTSSTPATTTGQATLTFGPSVSAFGSSFSTSAKPLLPYPSAASQPAFSAGAVENQLPGFSGEEAAFRGLWCFSPRGHICTSCGCRGLLKARLFLLCWPRLTVACCFPGTPAPTFGQSTPVPGAVGSGSSSLSFGTPSTPASGFGGVGASFGSSTPAFSIGAGSRMGARQRLQARRQHTRKK
uniref:Uncharacterized protein n=1 Tax=Bubo bubo TaxID=30461 RepID=A0A8C0F1T5_BUBBB